MKKKKIIIFGKHFANIDSDFYQRFEEVSKINNFTSWIKEQVLYDFGIDIKCSTDIELIDKKLSEMYYQDKREWLAEKMRNILNTAKMRSELSNEIICYRFLNKNKEFVNSKELTSAFINEFIESESILIRIEKNHLHVQDIDGSIPDVIQRYILSFEYPMRPPYYLKQEEYTIIKEIVKGTPYEDKLQQP